MRYRRAQERISMTPSSGTLLYGRLGTGRAIPGSRCAQDDAALCRRGPSVYSHPFEASGCSAAAREPDRAVLQLEAFADSELSGEPPGTSTARRAVLQFRAFAERSGVGASAARDPDARRRRPYRRAVLGRGGDGRASAEADAALRPRSLRGQARAALHEADSRCRRRALLAGRHARGRARGGRNDDATA